MITATQIRREERERIRKIILEDVSKLKGQKVKINITIGDVFVEAEAEIKDFTIR